LFALYASRNAAIDVMQVLTYCRYIVEKTAIRLTTNLFFGRPCKRFSYLVDRPRRRLYSVAITMAIRSIKEEGMLLVLFVHQAYVLAAGKKPIPL
jgi:hypothetical protein